MGWLSKSSRRYGAACESGSEKRPTGAWQTSQHTCSCKNGEGVLSRIVYICVVHAKTDRRARRTNYISLQGRPGEGRVRLRPPGRPGIRWHGDASPMHQRIHQRTPRLRHASSRNWEDGYSQVADWPSGKGRNRHVNRIMTQQLGAATVPRPTSGRGPAIK